MKAATATAHFYPEDNHIGKELYKRRVITIVLWGEKREKLAFKNQLNPRNQTMNTIQTHFYNTPNKYLAFWQ